MLPPEIADLKSVLLGMVTNSESQAIRWAHQITKQMAEKGWSFAEKQEQAA
jgi:hypothetical protein